MSELDKPDGVRKQVGDWIRGAREQDFFNRPAAVVGAVVTTPVIAGFALLQKAAWHIANHADKKLK